MQPSLTHVLDRTVRLRRRFENERRRPGVPASRLLRLQALLLEAQKRLADAIDRMSPGLVPVPVRAVGSSARPATWR